MITCDLCGKEENVMRYEVDLFLPGGIGHKTVASFQIDLCDLHVQTLEYEIKEKNR